MCENNSKFVIISKLEFENGLSWVQRRLPEICGEFTLTIPEGTKEYVYEIKTPNNDIVIHVFSSVHIVSNISRDKGLDAIRVVALHQGRELFCKKPYTKRTVNWADNLFEKIKDVLEQITQVPVCPKCGRLMLQRKGKDKSIFWGCSNYPNCKHTISICTQNQVSKQPKVPKVTCPTCGKEMVKRKGLYGEFYGCSDFPKCKHTIKI